MSAPTRAMGVAVAVAVLGLPACTDGVADGAIPSDARTSEVAELVSTTPITTRPGQRSVDVGTTFDWGSFRMTVGHVIYDADLRAVGVGVRVRNSANVWRQSTWPGAGIRIGDQDVLLSGPIADLPPGAIADLTLTGESLPSDPLSGGTFHLGAADEQQVEIPLVDRAARSEDAAPDVFLTRPVPVDGWASIGKYSIHVTGGQLLSTSDVGAKPALDERVLRLTYDLFAIRMDPVQGFGAGEHLLLTRPDGETVEPVAGGSLVFPWSWSAFPGLTVDFPVEPEAEGDYTLALSSISPIGLVSNPELIERAELPLPIRPASPVPVPEEPSPVPDVRLLRDPLALPTAEPDIPAADVALAVTGNPTGFLVRLSRMSRAAGDPEIRIDADVEALAWREPDPDADDEDLTQGVLAADPQFSPTVVLIADGQVVNGTIETTDYGIPHDGRELAFVFTPTSGTPPADLDDATLIIGNRSVRPAYVPLGPASPMPLDPVPPAREGTAIDADPIVADDWTVDVVSSRVGLFAGDVPPGKTQLEVELDVALAATAEDDVLGRSFRPEAQVFLARSDGYLVQAVKTAVALPFEDGQRRRTTAVFTIDAGLLDRTGASDLRALVIRSRDESGDRPERFVEVTAPIVLLP